MGNARTEMDAPRGHPIPESAPETPHVYPYHPDTTRTIHTVLELVRLEADAAETSAACNGAMNDGGARATREQIKIYIAGRNGVIPDSWKHHEATAIRLNGQRELAQNPEFLEFQRLHARFGHLLPTAK